jgi:hypothetical protein
MARKKSGGKLNASDPFRTGGSSGGATGRPGTSNVTGGPSGKARKGGKIMGNVKPKR